MEPKGLLSVDMRVSGPAWEPEGMSVTGEINATSVSCRLDSSFATGVLENANARVSLLADKIIVHNLRGKLRSIDVAASGTVVQDGMDARVDASGMLPDFQSAFPRLLNRDWTVGGRVSAQARLSARAKPGSLVSAPGQPLKTFLATMQGAFQTTSGTRFSVRLLDEHFDWNLESEARADNVEFTHVITPVPLTGLTGNFALRNKVFRTVGQVEGKWGHTWGKATGSFEMTPEGYAKAVLNGDFPESVLEDWVRGWGRPGRPRRVPPSWDLMSDAEFTQALRTKEELQFVLDATLVTKHSTFKKISLDDGTIHLIYSHRGAPHDSLDFDRIHCGIYGGKAEATVGVLIMPGFQWKTVVSVKDTQCERLLKALSNKESTVTGKLSTDLTVAGRAGRKDGYTGSGSFELTDSRFLRDPIFTALATVLRFKELQDISFSELRGSFGLKQGVVDLKDVKFFGTLLQLEANGQVGLDKNLDVMVIYRFLGPMGEIMSKIPVISMVPKMINQVGQILLKAHVGGTFSKPSVTVVPFSADELRFFQFEKVRKK